MTVVVLKMAAVKFSAPAGSRLALLCPSYAWPVITLCSNTLCACRAALVSSQVSVHSSYTCTRCFCSAFIRIHRITLSAPPRSRDMKHAHPCFGLTRTVAQLLSTIVSPCLSAT